MAMDPDVVGAIKIKDGLFIGDEFAAQDLEFVVANKVTHVINCSGRQVPNHWEPIGVRYLTYFWLDQDTQVILDPKDQVANECYAFINEALERGDSILVHSVKGQSRACTIVASWIMRRYKWTLLKTLEFLNSRRPDLEIRANFIHQLTAYENRLVGQGCGPKTSKWTEVFERTNDFENEELLLRNTYLNAQMGPFADFSLAAERPRPPKVRWVDDSREKAPLATVIGTDIDPRQRPGSNANDLAPIMKSYGHSRNSRGPSESASANSGKDDKKLMRKINPKDNNKAVKQHSARDPVKPEDIHAQIANHAIVKKPPQGTDIKIASVVKPTTNAKVPVINPAKVSTESKGAFQRSKPLAEMPRAKEEVKDTDIRIVPKFNNFIDPDMDYEDRRRGPVKQVGSKVSESINQMMDLNAAMSEKCGLYKDLHKEHKAEPASVTHIINQNNINNYIIHNPQKVEVIGYNQSKPVPETRPVAEPIVKKIIPPKKTSAPVRSSSASVRRDPIPSKPISSKDTNSRERPKPSSSIREKKVNPSAYEGKMLINPHNVTNVIIDKNPPGESLANAPLRLVTASNNVLSSFRNGPVKPVFNPTVKAPMKPTEVAKPRNPTPLSRDPHVTSKPPPQKKQRPSTAQHARPASPGIRGKVAEPLYKNTIKSYVVSREKGKSGTSPRQPVSGQSAMRATVTNMSLRGMSPGKPRWKS